MRALPWLVAAALASSCSPDPDCGGPIGPLPQFEVQNGVWSPYAVEQQTGELPLAGGEDLQVEIDRAAGTVVISYMRDGESVREIWRVESSSFSVR